MNRIDEKNSSKNKKKAFIREIYGGLSTFRSLLKLLSSFVFTNTTQILQICKQMECDNNKH